MTTFTLPSGVLDHVYMLDAEQEDVIETMTGNLEMHLREGKIVRVAGISSGPLTPCSHKNRLRVIK